MMAESKTTSQLFSKPSITSVYIYFLMALLVAVFSTNRNFFHLLFRDHKEIFSDHNLENLVFES